MLDRYRVKAYAEALEKLIKALQAVQNQRVSVLPARLFPVQVIFSRCVCSCAVKDYS